MNKPKEIFPNIVVLSTKCRTKDICPSLEQSAGKLHQAILDGKNDNDVSESQEQTFLIKEDISWFDDAQTLCRYVLIIKSVLFLQSGNSLLLPITDR